MPTPANNKTPVWFRPRDAKEDQVCYYIRDARKEKLYDLKIHDPHPRAGYDDEFKDMVFLYREPYGDRTGTAGALVKDWYGPKELVDNVTNIVNEGSVYQSTLIYGRGLPAPTEDERLQISGEFSTSGCMTARWDLTEDEVVFTLDVGEFLGNEVYLNITEPTGDVVAGIYVITRHVSSTEITVAQDYDEDFDLGSSHEATASEACYILDGWTDGESAPGVLANLFHMRRFTYRLAEKSITAAWDESLGLEILTERQFVPSSWARNLDGTPASTADDNSSTSYEIVSKKIANKVDRFIVVDDDGPDQDGLTWSSDMRIQVPPILRQFSIPYSYAYAVKNAYKAYDQRYGVDKEVIGPMAVSCPTRHLRRVVLEADVSSTITAVKAGDELFSFQPRSYGFVIQGYWWYAGSNTYARAMVMPVTLGPYILGDTEVSAEVPTSGYAGLGGVGIGNPDDSTGTGIWYDDGPPKKIVLGADLPPWETEVLWDIKTTKARWGYWMIDFVYVTLPANPATPLTP